MSLASDSDGMVFLKSVFKDGMSVYSRDRTMVINTLAYAQFVCEIDNEHPTFIQKNSDKTYTER